jgi:Flp pilus assembly protein TadD
LHNKLPGQAEEYLRRILSIDQQNLAALNNLAVVKIMQEEFEVAQIILDRILQIHPGDENARENLQFLRKVRTLDRR